eukprot:TRINITY_DN1246_c0_g1_i1.p1 TRINITY_DN1246_c0_g1~~TRINITY_DN1246_c0_g1_i1.p1  ORF type:complete len:382 (-),score=102.00 TRINITY_DN1246_c0_g1_i1:435-1580(-)
MGNTTAKSAVKKSKRTAKLTIAGENLSRGVSISALQDITHLLREISLESDKLRELPEDLKDLSHLGVLSLANNELSALPNSIGELKMLVVLNLARNRLEALPDSFGNLRHLTVLKLSHNSLRLLPNSFGLLTSLIEVDLSDNKLRSLPPSFSKMANLRLCDLRTNEFTDLPSNLAQMPSLRALLVDGNPLSKVYAEMLALRRTMRASTLLAVGAISSLPSSRASTPGPSDSTSMPGSAPTSAPGTPQISRMTVADTDSDADTGPPEPPLPPALSHIGSEAVKTTVALIELIRVHGVEPVEADGSHIDLVDILNDSDAWVHLRDFAQKEFNQENVDFWLEANHFKINTAHDSSNKMRVFVSAKVIYDKFVKKRGPMRHQPSR